MALYGLLVLPIIAVEGDGFGPMMTLWAFGAFIFFFPWFFWITSVIWVFKGQGAPRSFEEVKKELLSINSTKAPVMITEKSSTHLVVTWKYVDAKWFGCFRKAGMTSTYHLHIKLKSKSHTAILVDKLSTIKWNAGIDGFGQSWMGFTGILMGISMGKAYGIRENFTLGKIYDYHFDPMEIKNPVFNSLLRMGWTVRFGLL
jgi:hypothetical protein